MHDDKYREEQKQEMIKLLCWMTALFIMIAFWYFAIVGIIHSIQPA